MQNLALIHLVETMSACLESSADPDLYLDQKFGALRYHCYIMFWKSKILSKELPGESNNTKDQALFKKIFIQFLGTSAAYSHTRQFIQYNTHNYLKVPNVEFNFDVCVEE